MIHSYEEWSSKLSKLPKMDFIVYKMTPEEEFLSKLLPYCPFLDMTKRERVILRSRLRNAWKAKVAEALTKALMEAKPRFEKVDLDPSDYEWTII